MTFLRRVRGALGTAVSWAVVWGLVGAVASPYLLELERADPSDLIGRVITAGTVAWYGFLGGALFAGVVAVAARHRSLAELTARGIAAWGALSGLLLTVPPVVYMLSSRTGGVREDDVVFVVGSFVLSAVCAAGTLLLARRGSMVGPDALTTGEVRPSALLTEGASRFGAGNLTSVEAGEHAKEAATPHW